MHVLPLPFGMALALLSRSQAKQAAKPKVVQPRRDDSAARDLNRPGIPYAGLRQVV